MLTLFHPMDFGAAQRAELDERGHVCLPGLLTLPARAALTESLSRIRELMLAFGSEPPGERTPARYAAEQDPLLESLIGHPQLVALARAVLGPTIRYDHCVALSREPGYSGLRWHTHEYADAQPELGFLRIFFYVNGFGAGDGSLKVVPGSHLFRDSQIKADGDDELATKWLAGKRHPLTGEPLHIEELSAPEGSVILMWTHALHGVTPRRPGSTTRWTVVYAYRNPGQPSPARWISEEFERKPVAGADGLMSLY